MLVRKDKKNVRIRNKKQLMCLNKFLWLFFFKKVNIKSLKHQKFDMSVCPNSSLTALSSRKQKYIHQPWHHGHRHLTISFYPFWAWTLKVCAGTRASASDPGSDMCVRAHPVEARCAWNCENSKAESTLGVSLMQRSVVWVLQASWGHTLSANGETQVCKSDSSHNSEADFFFYFLTAFRTFIFICGTF